MATDQDALNDEESGTGGIPWKMAALIIITGIFMWVLFRDETLCTQDGRLCYQIWMLYTLILTMFYWLMNAGYIWLKYKSPQFIGNNIHGSITGREAISAGKFYLLTLGGIDWGVTADGRECTVIFPQEAYNRLGNQVGAPCRFAKVKLCQLSTLVQQKILQSGFPAPYWYGDIDESQYDIKAEDLDEILSQDQSDKLEKLTEMFGNFKKFNPAQLKIFLLDGMEQVSKLRKEREILMKEAESVVSFGVRLSDKAKHVGKVRNPFRGKDENE